MGGEMARRRVSLKTILIIAFVLFVLIIIIRVTNGLFYIIKFFEIAGLYIVLLTLLVVIGFLIFLVFFNKKVDRDSDVEAKAWNFLQKWWEQDMGMLEKLKLQDGFMKRGYYSSNGMTELFVGFNVTKKGSNQRMIFVVGTKPLSIAHFSNLPNILDDTDPFENWYSLPPSPIPFYDDNALKSRFAGKGFYNFPHNKFDKNKRKDDDELEEHQQ